MPQKPNLVEKLVGWIPGYKGYAEREARRDTDRLLREAVIRSLEPGRKAVDGAIAECSKTSKFEHLESLESIRRGLATTLDGLKHAPSGYSGFFDTMKIDLDQLDAIAEHDARLRELTPKLVAALTALEAPSKETFKSARAALDDLAAGIRRRTDLLKGAE